MGGELLPVDGFSDCRVQKGGTAESDHALQDRNHTDRTGKTDLLRGYGPDTVVLYGGWPDTGKSGKVGRFGGQLAIYENFLRPHRSYLINMDYIRTLSSKSIVMQNQEEIPIPHGKYSDIKTRYLEYAFERQEIVV